MTEARAASRLNHPNVVSIFDFGRAFPEPEAPLFLAMEFLAGPSLADVIDAGKKLPFLHIAQLLEQVLAALGEAHEYGITHRDVKPGNIVLEPLRGEGSRVKVIDFGVARIEAERRATQPGQVMGTPHYMAPELALDAAVGPSVDLYAVGIILYELLTGAVPFDGRSPQVIFAMHQEAPRPDPRDRAPDRGIPNALAEVCLRALSIDPKDRFPNADALARAILAAATIAPSSGRTMAESPIPGMAHAPTIPVPRTSAPSISGPLLVGRVQTLARARELLSRESGVGAIVFFGTTGSGRTRLLDETLNVAEEIGALARDAGAFQRPRDELSYEGLRTVITELVGRVEVPSSADPLVARGIAEIFGSPGAAPFTPAENHRRLQYALRWAGAEAVRRAGTRVVVALDDVDNMDGLSLSTLAGVLKAGGCPGLVFVMTCEDGAWLQGIEGVLHEEVPGLLRDEVRRLAGSGRGSNPGGEPAASARRIPPLYLELFRRWRSKNPASARAAQTHGPGRPPSTLAELVDAIVCGLPALQRRVVQAVAVLGGATVTSLSAVLPRPEGIAEAVGELVEEGILVSRRGELRIAHSIFGRIALESAPSGALEELHQRAAALLANAPQSLELRAYHAVRGRPDLQAFMLLEESARKRTERGDDDGAVRALRDGYLAARARLAKGEGDALGSGWVVFGRKLADALLNAARTDQAHGVLREILEGLGPDEPGRGAVLELLARTASARGKHIEALRFQREAAVAEAAEERRFTSRQNREESPSRSRRRVLQEKPQQAPVEELPRRSHTGVMARDARAEEEAPPSSRRGEG